VETCVISFIAHVLNVFCISNAESSTQCGKFYLDIQKTFKTYIVIEIAQVLHNIFSAQVIATAIQQQHDNNKNCKKG
jgi:hypothetical protein